MVDNKNIKFLTLMLCIFEYQVNQKWQKEKQELKLKRKPEEEELKPSLSISTRFLNKFTQTSVSPRKP